MAVYRLTMCGGNTHKSSAVLLCAMCDVYVKNIGNFLENIKIDEGKTGKTRRKKHIDRKS